MTHAREDHETSLPRLTDLRLSQLDAVDPVVLRESVLLLLDRLKKEQAPINSFQARI